MKKITNVTIIGLGLIGGSLGLAIKKVYPKVLVTGYARKRSAVKKALRVKAIDKGTSDITKSVVKADLVIIAVPIRSIVQIVNKIQKYIRTDAIVLDVGSTKKYVVSQASKLMPHNFIGGHPMAGAETTGIENARPGLLINKTFILTPIKTTDVIKLKQVKEFLERLKMHVITLIPEAHDYIVAGTSGAPYFAACGLAHIVSQMKPNRKFIANLIGSGFKDTTRLALSDPRWGIDMANTNTKHISVMLTKVITNLKNIKRYINDSSKKNLMRFLNKNRRMLLEMKARK